MDRTIFTATEEETVRVGKELAGDLKPNDVVFLTGNLGSGKTTFTKGIAEGLGIETRIISPTFVVVREHTVPKEPSPIKTLYHLDLYRLQNEKEVLGIDMKDYLDDENGVVVIEWPEIGQNLVNKKVWIVHFETTDHEGRKITISYV